MRLRWCLLPLRGLSLGEFALSLPLALAAIYLGLRHMAGDGGLAHIEDGQIAVVVDNLRLREVVLNSNDPRFTALFDLELLVRMLLGPAPSP